MRSLRQNIFLFLKGVAMGGADVVPGVSGGTIALISGIYEELIDTINSINLTSIQLIFKGQFKAFWKAINGNFLSVLFAGIVVSFVSLAKLMTHLLEHYPLLLWSFFFGLIVASAWLIGKELKPFKAIYGLALIIGIGVSYFITTIAPSTASTNLPYLFLCGMIAICAMILPGISGSFILLLLGAYATVLGAVASLSDDLKGNLSIIASVGAGAVIGLLAFSRLLNWLFKKYRQETMALMTGFLIGSLNKVWPWQHVTEIHVKHLGEENEEVVPMAWENVWPNSFDTFIHQNGEIISHTPADPQIYAAILLSLAGFLTIFLLEKIGSIRSTD